MKKLGLLFAVVVMSLMFAVSASALEPTGQCGDNVYWEYDETTGELVISGEGAMWDYVYEFDFGDSPFYNSDINDVSVNSGITRIGDGIFSCCGSLKSIYIPESVTAIGEGAFCGCESLKSVIIPDSVANIGKSAFTRCRDLRNVILPKDLEILECNLFSGCSSLETIDLPENLLAIEENAFSGVAINNINLPDSLIRIGRYAFSYSCIEKLAIPESITLFDVNVVLGCEWLNMLTIINPICEIESTSNNLKIPRQTILASFVNSTTEQYANENNYHFLPLDGENAGVIQNHKYSVDWKTVLPATCTERGLMVKVCNICSDVESQVIIPSGHLDANSDYKCDYGCGYEFEQPTPEAPDEPEVKLNFFQKIIQWFKDLFAKLFGWL